jgi:hypothetical protein
MQVISTKPTQSAISLPGALAAYGLSLGVARINEKLPDPVYALLAGLNSATVGIIALAAVQLSQKAITDKLTRILVFLGGTAGMLYNALWYFPVLMMAAGCATTVWDSRVIQNHGRKLQRKFRRGQTSDTDITDVEATQLEEVSQGSNATAADSQNPSMTARSRPNVNQSIPSTTSSPQETVGNATHTSNTTRTSPELNTVIFSWKLGCVILVGFFVCFIILMVLRGVLNTDSRGFNVFANMFLAGTYQQLLCQNLA